MPNKAEIDLVTVATSTDNLQWGLMKSLLEDNGIPCMAKEKRSGSFLEQTMGFSLYGTELLVERENEAKAKELLDSFFHQDMETETEKN